jgi:hypothetical protein
VIGFPAVKTLIEEFAAPYNFVALQPGIDRLSFELNENTFTAVLDSWKPGHIQRKWRASDLQVQIVRYIAIDVCYCGFKSGGSKLCGDFAQAMDKDDSFDVLKKRRIPYFALQSSSVKITLRYIASEFLFGFGEGFELDFLYRPVLASGTGANTANGLGDRIVVVALKLVCYGRFLAQFGDIFCAVGVGEEVVPQRTDDPVQRTSGIRN